MIPLKYNTSGAIVVGPIIKTTDGYSALTGIASGSLDAWYAIGTATYAYATADIIWSELADGFYTVGYSTNLTRTVGGKLTVSIIASSSGIPIWEQALILSANAYDSLVTTADYLQTDVAQMGGTGVTTQAAVNWSTWFDNAGAAVGKDIGDVSTFGTANQVDMGAIAGTVITTQAAVNFSTWFDNGGVAVGKDIGDVSTFGTANQVDLGAVLGTAVTTQAAVNWSTFFDNAGAGVGKVVGDMATMTSASLSTFGTANQVDIGAILGTAITTQAAVNFSTFFDNGGAASTIALGDVSTFGTGVVYDTLDHGQLMQYVQGYITGDFKVTGAASNQIVYDEWDGTTFFSHTITSALRTFTSN